MKQKANTKTKSMDKRKLIIITSCVAAALAVGIVLSIVLAVVLPLISGGKGYDSFRAPENALPTEEKFALQKYDYDSLSDVQVTMRADVMNVTKRDLPRPVPEIVSDDFSITYDTDTHELKAVYGELVKSSGTLKSASISFNPDAYPSPSKAVSSAAYAQAAAAAGVSEADYFSYFKYMLLTQGQHLAVEAQQMSANGTLTQEWLKKHPSADAQYGAVLGENNAVEKEITLDPLYRSAHATGLYLPAGELVTVKVEGLKAGEKISMIVGRQNSLAWRGAADAGAFNALTGGLKNVKAAPSDAFFIQADVLTANGDFFKYNSGDSTPYLQSQWKRQNTRAPWMSAEFVFDGNGEYKIGTAFGGIMHINPRNCYSHAKTTITGAVETPHYILGVTTPEYFDKYLRDAPGVVGVIDTENGQLIGPTGAMGTKAYLRQIKTEEADKLAMLWHSFFSVNESFTGGTYNRPNTVLFDQHVPAGAAVALGGYVYACPTGWYNTATNYRALLTGGQWGILHEIGHNHASSYGTFWGFGDGKEGEVHNNALTTLAYIMFCDLGTMRDANGNIPAEHGFVAHPYSSLSASISVMNKSYTDYSQNNYFEMLSMYSNIMHSFGAEKFYELLYTYKSRSAYLSDKRADYTYRCAMIYGMDFRTYFNKYYKANLNDDKFILNNADGTQSREILEMLDGLPEYEPIASYYAGGIDGVKTGGDYRIAFGDYAVFDLLNKTICALDTAESKGFEIIGIDQPEHGTVVDLGNGRYRYAFDKKYTGTFDKFSYYVKMKNADATVHKLDVHLRISYNSSRVSVYSGISDPGVSGAPLFESFDNLTAQMTPEYENSALPGVAAYSSAAGQVRIADFRWKSTVTGEVALAVAGSGSIALSVGSDFAAMERTNLIYSNGAANLGNASNADKFKHVMRVEKGNYYNIRLVTSNIRRLGQSTSASVVILQKNGEVCAEPAMDTDAVKKLWEEGARYANIPLAGVYHPDYPLDTEATQYVYEPKYMVSKKDNIKLSTTGTDKNEWSDVTAPENRYEEQAFIDPETGEQIGTLKIDKWTYLIDGQTGTMLHTAWRGSEVRPPSDSAPDVFVIDTARVQPFNYFTVTTRHSQNDDARITSYRLSVSDDNVNYNVVSQGKDEDGTGLKYSVISGSKVATLKFDQVMGRYWKLEAFKTSGRNFTIVSELDAGVQSQTQRVIAPTSSKLYTSKAWKDSKTIESEPNGYLIAQKKNSKAVIRFKGDSFALYAATGAGYGSIKIKLDGKLVTTVPLNSEIEESRKLVFTAEQLNKKEHTVEIITLNSSKVMLNVIGIPYTAELINAPNIYLEHNLAVALSVFVVLFAALLALILCLVFIPKFRNLVFGNKVMKKYDEMSEQKSAKRAEERKTVKAAQPEKKTEKDKKPDPHEIVERNLKAKKAASGEKPVEHKPAAHAASSAQHATASHHATAASAHAPSKPAARPTAAARPAQSAAKPEKRVIPPSKK